MKAMRSSSTDNNNNNNNDASGRGVGNSSKKVR